MYKRQEFERITKDLLDRCRKPVEQALRDASMSQGDIDEVILVGGSTRMPAVQELVKDPEFAQWMDPTSRTVPAGAEDRQMFFNRTSSMLMKMFEYMLRTHTEEAACVTHGGVIMNMLSQHALPFRKPEEWMTDPGAGYSVRLDAEMWMRDHLAEAYDVVPHGYLDGME